MPKLKLSLDDIKKRLLGKQSETLELSRDMAVDTETINKDECTAEFSVSSEEPYLRWFGYEILDHNATSIRWGRLNDGAAHRDTHYGDQIGIVEKAWIDPQQKKMRVKVRFSKNTERAVTIFNDIIDGIRRNVSIAYQIYDLVLERQTDTEDYYRVMDWEPIHTCHTPDGADPTVGNGRSRGEDKPEAVILPLNLEVEDGNYEKAIEGLNRDNKTQITIKHKRSSIMDEEEKKLAAEKEARETAAREARDKELREGGEKAAQDNAASIVKIASDLQDNVRNINLNEKAREYISGGKHFKEFYDYVTAEMKKPEAIRTALGHIDVGEKTMKTYSLRNALLAMGDPAEYGKLGLEREINIELAKETGRDHNKSLMIPTDAFGFARENVRAQVVGTPNLGGVGVFDTPVPQTFIEYLHNKTCFVGSGVNVMDNLVGDIPLIREGNEHEFTFKLERVAPDASDVVFTRETYGSKLGGSYTTLSRQILLQVPQVSEAWARKKLLGAVNRGIDKKIPYGAGGVEPFGFMNMTGPHGISGVDFDRNTAIDMIQSIIAVNAELGTFNFVGNPLVIGTLKKRPIVATYPSFLCDDNNNMAGLPVRQSNQVTNGHLFYGGWQNLDLLLWGYILVEANPWGPGWGAGDIDVKANIAMNIMSEHPEAISIAENVN